MFIAEKTTQQMRRLLKSRTDLTEAQVEQAMPLILSFMASLEDRMCKDIAGIIEAWKTRNSKMLSAALAAADVKANSETMDAMEQGYEISLQGMDLILDYIEYIQGKQEGQSILKEG